MVNATANEDRFGLADWVFSGFLFMVGLLIQFAFAACKKLGHSNYKMLYYIIIRALSLLVIGVFMVA